MDKQRKIKVEFESSSFENFFVEEIFNEGVNSVIKNAKTSLGIGKFPTATLEINATSKYPNLISIKSGDAISISVSEGNKPFVKIFSGILSLVSIKSQNENHQITMNCVSPFYSMQKKEITSNAFINKFGFREIISEVIDKCGIDGKIIIHKNISNEFKLFSFKNFPAISLLNAICYKLDLVYEFKNENVLEISKLKDVFNKMDNSVPITITPEQIISSEFKQ